MERLNDMYNNMSYDDNEVIIRTLNTVLEKHSESRSIYVNLVYMVKLLEDLNKVNKRSDIEFIVDNIKSINNFNDFKKVLANIIDQDMSIYKYVFLMCYCRSLFETKFVNNILYTKPEYAIQQVLGKEAWVIFLSSFKKCEYKYNG